jgi:hypothetical protein
MKKIGGNLGIHIPQRIEEINVFANDLESILNDLRIGGSGYAILERGHVNISTSKWLTCPPTHIREGAH